MMIAPVKAVIMIMGAAAAAAAAAAAVVVLAMVIVMMRAVVVRMGAVASNIAGAPRRNETGKNKNEYQEAAVGRGTPPRSSCIPCHLRGTNHRRRRGAQTKCRRSRRRRRSMGRVSQSTQKGVSILGRFAKGSSPDLPSTTVSMTPDP
jgi:hypothetical protein